MRVLVTGGNGFLGRSIVHLLTSGGHETRSLSRHPSPLLEKEQVEQHKGDIRDFAVVKEAARDCDCIIHTAAKAGVWGPTDEYEQINVQGTRNVIKAARETGVAKIVYSSTPSVVFDGSDESGITEDKATYPKRFLNDYSRTKAAAEQEILGANSPNLATVALRPHLIWGPGDPHLLPRLWGRFIQGKLRLVGSGQNRIDTTYIDNAARAHLLAMEKLGEGAPCAGKAYFLSNGEPMPIEELFRKFLAVMGLPPTIPKVSEWVAWNLSKWWSFRAKLLRDPKEPPLTPFVVLQLAREHWFDLTRAKTDLGYHPWISIEQGLTRLKQSLAAVKMPDSVSSLSAGS